MTDDFSKLAEAINKAHGGEPVTDVALLCRRVQSVAADRKCWITSYRDLHREYLRMDDVLRGRLWWRVLRRVFPLRVKLEWRKP